MKDMIQDIELKPLPPKWKVKNLLEGFCFFDDKNILQLKNAKDTNSIRNFCWAIYNKIEGK